MINLFNKQGFVGPFPILSPKQCKQFLQIALAKDSPPPHDWMKGNAAHARAYYQIATHPGILEPLVILLGDDILLWGASIVKRKPGQRHAWHTDIESVVSNGKTLSVWVGLKNITRKSCLTYISYSHKYGKTLQEARQGNTMARDTCTDEDVVRWGRLEDERSALHTINMSEGEAFLFDGNLWHGSHNTSGKTRFALLLQYATPDAEICIPDPNYTDWPFRKLLQPKPACIMIRGSDKFGVNRIVSAPVMDDQSTVLSANRVQSIGLPLRQDPEKGWKPYHLFKGVTAQLNRISCHVSILNPGNSPHPPHAHEDEEILMVLDGDVQLELPDLSGQSRISLSAGQFVYYPGNFHHTLTTTSDHPATYLMFKWFADSIDRTPDQNYGLYNVCQSLTSMGDEGKFITRKIFEGSTKCLQKLQCHVSMLAAGSGYEPHADAYDVAIVTLEGQVETIGERIGPHHVIFYPAGQVHGMHNPGNVPAKYVVFEFHGSYSPVRSMKRKGSRSFFDKLRDPKSWKRKIGQILGK